MTTDTTALQERIKRALWEALPDVPEEDYGSVEPWLDRHAAAVLPIIAAEVRTAKAEALREMQEHHEREADKAQTIAARGIHLTIADGARERATEHETGDSDERR